MALHELVGLKYSQDVVSMPLMTAMLFAAMCALTISF